MYLNKKYFVFLFVFYVWYIEEISLLLKLLYNKVEGVYVEDLMRKEKVVVFRKGEILLLVIMIILEWGVMVINL